MRSASHNLPGVFRLGLKPDTAGARFPLKLGAEGVHEICEHAHGDMGAISGFAIAAAQFGKGPIFWARQYALRREHGRLLQAGLSGLGVKTQRLFLHAETRRLADTLWVIEEAVRSSAFSAVIAEIEDIDFTSSRRLTLAAGRYGVPVILLLPWRREGSSAAAARWRVKPRPSASNPFDSRAPGAFRWQVTLERSRIAPALTGRVFNLELDDETLSLRVVSGMAANTPAARTSPPLWKAIEQDFRRSA
ncbi:MAG: hypothetical protein VX593_03030 [Pseudomonadota bacterium]|nr:hypothetical protein [Pseudomonadota bacterium]